MAASLVLSTRFSSIPHKTHHRSLSLPSSSVSTAIFINPKSKPNKNDLFFLKNHSKEVLVSWKFIACASIGDTETKDSSSVGENSAAFDLEEQKISSWIYFTVILGVVLFVLNVVWIDNSTEFGKAFIEAVSGLSDSHEVVMLILILIFASVHSGMASFRGVPIPGSAGGFSSPFSPPKRRRFN